MLSVTHCYSISWLLDCMTLSLCPIFVSDFIHALAVARIGGLRMRCIFIHKS